MESCCLAQHGILTRRCGYKVQNIIEYGSTCTDSMLYSLCRQIALYSILIKMFLCIVEY